VIIRWIVPSRLSTKNISLVKQNFIVQQDDKAGILKHNYVHLYFGCVCQMLEKKGNLTETEKVCGCSQKKTLHDSFQLFLVRYDAVVSPFLVTRLFFMVLFGIWQTNVSTNLTIS